MVDDFVWISRLVIAGVIVAVLIGRTTGWRGRCQRPWCGGRGRRLRPRRRHGGGKVWGRPSTGPHIGRIGGRTLLWGSGHPPQHPPHPPPT
jgi:hypothetical protein